MVNTKQNKKGQGMSLNVVIIAILALLVLVILSIILVGRTGWFNKGSLTCENNGGQCVEQAEDCTGETSRIAYDYTCKVAEGDPAKVCCIRI